ncbi:MULTISPECIES: DMT family transporter [Halorussus]|uniref:DMT family transporter n=1 Tax=Halorussus TaxID=1070314 RepID=UPI00209FE71D|nr:DMT family transporter [Halorussus vallis]USZ74863.1 DMT family transporter [Halorussus vallis]
MSESRTPAIFAPLLAATIWGGMYVASKWGFGLIPPVTLAFLRVVLGAGTLLLAVRLTRPERSFSRREWRRLGTLGLLVGLTMVTQFLGTDYTTASQGSLLTVLTPVFTLAFGASFLGERLTRRRLGGMALAAAGTMVVLGSRYELGSLGRENAAGVALLVVASAGWAAYTVVGTPLVRRYSALEVATYSTALSVPMVGVLVPLELGRAGTSVAAMVRSLGPLAVATVLYLGVASTALAWYLWYSGVERADASAVAVAFFAQPLVGSALGAALLGEALGPGFLLGGLVLAVGVYVVDSDASASPDDADVDGHGFES